MLILPEDSHPSQPGKPRLVLCAAGFLFTAGLLVYSQTMAFAYDEGFHLLAAQLIERGRRPYLDFFFPQTPLNAYWNALWFHIFTDSWRVAHVAGSLLVAGAVILIMDYLFRRFPIADWRLAAAFTVAYLLGLNEMVVQFGLLQAYGFCLFTMVAGFRLTVAAVERRSVFWALLAGLAACAAPAASLLSAPAAPVCLIWMLVCNRAGSRWAKGAAFLAGGAVPFIPLLWLFAQAPKVVLFNIVEYHAFHRQEQWEGAIEHDVDVYTAWLNSSQGIVLLLLAAWGILYIARRSGWPREDRREFYLCGWLALAITLHLFAAHPTFPRYWLLVIPFLSVLAAAGLYAFTLRWRDGGVPPPFWPVGLVTILTALGLGKSIFDQRDGFFWKDAEEISSKVAQVTPPDSTLLATEHVYFILKRTPATGLEHNDSHKLQLPPALAQTLHVFTEAELFQRIKAGAYHTFETCDTDDDKIKDLKLDTIYAQTDEIAGCAVYWQLKRR